MTSPASTVDQNILPVQAYFNVDGSFNTFIGQGQPFVISATESIGIINTSVNATFYPTFSPVSTGQVTSLDVTSSSFTFNPGTGVLSAPFFSGTLNGTATATTSIANGASSQVLYQVAPGITGFIPNGTSGQFLLSNGTNAPSWATVATSVTIADQTSSSSTFYPLFYSATSGSTNTVQTSSTKYQYIPSTGTLISTVFSGSGALLTNIPNSALTNSSFTLGSTSIALGSTTTNIVGLVSITSSSFVGALTGSLASATGLPLTTGVTGILPIANGGTNSTAIPTNGGVIYGNGTAYAASSAGTNGQFLQSTGAGAPAWATISSTASTIGIASNSTNASYFPLFYTAATAASATTAYTASNYSFNPSTGTLSATAFTENTYSIVSQKDVGSAPNQIPLNQYLGSLAYQTIPTVGTLNYFASGAIGSFGANINNYSQIVEQNLNSGVSASSDFVVNNNLSTDFTYYGDFGITSSAYNSAGTNIINTANTVYLQSQSCNLALGTLTANPIQLVTNSIEASRIDTNGVFYDYSPSPTAVNATATLTIAQMQTLIVTVTSAIAVALTLPTGTLTDAGITSGTLPINQAFDWVVINLGSAVGAITLTANTGHTIVGNPVVAITTSAQFRTRKTATNTFVTYRIA